MLTFLFWNTNAKQVEANVARIARTHDVDVVVLAECSISRSRMLLAMNHVAGPQFRPTWSQCRRIQIYSRLSPTVMHPVFEDARLTIRRLSLPSRPDVLLAAVHFISKLRWSGESQSAECEALSNTIRDVERRAGHSRTVLVGDLNMNPFEPGMVKANGLNAAMARNVVRRESRTVQRRSYPFFYNPMWAMLGDRQGGPPGTYYYERAEHVTYFWNAFDQVLLRPALLECFPNESLRILTSDGSCALIDEKGFPDSECASDHLPIIFQLDI